MSDLSTKSCSDRVMGVAMEFDVAHCSARGIYIPYGCYYIFFVRFVIFNSCISTDNTVQDTGRREAVRKATERERELTNKY